jgi:hypothetical protein
MFSDLLAFRIGSFFQGRLLLYAKTSSIKLDHLAPQSIRAMVSTFWLLERVKDYSSDKTTHHKQVKEVLCCLQKHGLYAKPEKCEFDCKSVEYLSYILSTNGLTMAADKVQIFQDWPELWKIKDVQSFLGFANFYHCFIYNFSNILFSLRNSSSLLLFLLILSPTALLLLKLMLRTMP